MAQDFPDGWNLVARLKRVRRERMAEGVARISFAQSRLPYLTGNGVLQDGFVGVLGPVFLHPWPERCRLGHSHLLKTVDSLSRKRCVVLCGFHYAKHADSVKGDLGVLAGVAKRDSALTTSNLAVASGDFSWKKD
jgi:hypothetical protein